MEDEIPNYDVLKDKLKAIYPSIVVDGPVTNTADLRRTMLKQSKYDVVFCDIRLSDGDCFEVLCNMEVTTPLVFTTAYDEYALQAFETNGIAYLLKPIITSELKQATDKAIALGRGWQMGTILDKIRSNDNTPYLHYLRAKAINNIYMINVEDVSYFTIDEGGTIVVVEIGKRYRLEHTLEQLIQRLDPMMFFRANRKFIVSRKAILCIEPHGLRRAAIKIKNNDDAQIIISKSNVATISEWMEQ